MIIYILALQGLISSFLVIFLTIDVFREIYKAYLIDRNRLLCAMPALGIICFYAEKIVRRNKAIKIKKARKQKHNNIKFLKKCLAQKIK